jgi:sucrose phosphorylase
MTRPDILLDHLTFLYGHQKAQETYQHLEKLILQYSSLPSLKNKVGSRRSLSERDSILITYGDQLREPDQTHLRTLAKFCRSRLQGVVGGIHILPFYPYTSDDGFSVVDYRQVDPALGDWEAVSALGKSFRLMFDAVINHISSRSSWFQGFLHSDPKYRTYFITVEGAPDLSQVVRPRALPLLTAFKTAEGVKKVWTTFSEDQIDLNYQNPQVLLEIVELLLFYASQGAEFIRLDAIAYLWKEIGTSSIHLEQTHRVIRLFRAVLDRAAPQVFLITETNVPHEENLSYFGVGSNEAQLVYNFALPPLVVHTLHTEDATALSRWAAGLTLPSDQVTFFNFLASHDGIGLNPARGILAESEIDQLTEMIVRHGGMVSYKHNPDGSRSPYELNINYFDALSDPGSPEPLDTQVNRFVAAHAVMFSIIGMPGIYFHSLFGSRSWKEGVIETGRNRTINRQKFTLAELEEELSRPSSLPAQVFSQLSRLLSIRAAHPAFHPYGTQRVLECSKHAFTLLRTAPDEGEQIICVQSVAGSPQVVSFEFDGGFGSTRMFRDLITGEQVSASGKLSSIPLEPYQTIWLVEDLQ